MTESTVFYDRYCEIYHHLRITRGKLFNEYIEMPAVLGLIDSLTNIDSVLDVGCGSGIYAKVLTQRGFYVDGIDSSKGMIDIAREYCSSDKANFFVTPLEDYVSESKYDLVLGSFILGYFANLDLFFAKVKSFLKPNGAVIISGLHPIRESSTSRNDRFYLIENYFDLTEYKSIVIDGVEPLPVAKHIFSEISLSAATAGFNIQRILEPKPDLSKGSYVGKKNISFHLRNPSVVIFSLKLNANG